MRVVALRVQNFRGITELSWNPAEPLTCLVGPGDSGKTTILDAIEWALTPRWTLPVSDADFHRLAIDQPIVIRVTVANVPEELLTDHTFLHVAQYRCPAGIHDEPFHDDDEARLTVRLTIDETLEPRWEVVGGNGSQPRPISNQRRAALGVTRLGGDPDPHLRWGRGSSLERLTEEPGSAKLAITDVYRTARKGVTDDDLGSLADAVQLARAAIPTFGAGLPPEELRAAIDPSSFTPSAGALGLHVGDVPITRSGLGTRRLAALSLQAASVPDGAIVLVDEIESGLEPHRLRHVLRLLRDRATGTADENGPAPEQVFMTTHSPTAVVELNARELAIVRRDDTGLVIRHPDDKLQGVIRRHPEAILATSVIVCEGATEHGLVRGLDAAWTADGNLPLVHQGIAVVDGGGCTKAPSVAIQLADLGYRTSILVDSDQPIVPDAHAVEAHEVHIAQWADTMCTEQRVTNDVTEPKLIEILQFMCEERGEGQVRGDMASRLGCNQADLPADLRDWLAHVGVAEFRRAAGEAMAIGSWMKQIGVAEKVGCLIGQELPQIAETNLAEVLSGLRSWVHGA